MDPLEVDRRFAELVTTEFGADALGGDRPLQARPRQPGPEHPAPQVPSPPQTPSAPQTPSVRQVPPAPEPEPLADDDVDYRTPAPRPPWPTDVRIATSIVAAGLVVLVVGGFVTTLPAPLMWLASPAVTCALGWLAVRAMRRPPRDPDDSGIHL